MVNSHTRAYIFAFKFGGTWGKPHALDSQISPTRHVII